MTHKTHNKQKNILQLKRRTQNKINKKKEKKKKYRKPYMFSFKKKQSQHMKTKYKSKYAKQYYKVLKIIYSKQIRIHKNLHFLPRFECTNVGNIFAVIFRK